MSDCPICDNVGWTDEWIETNPDDEFKGEWIRTPCRNWRHSIPNPWPGIRAFLDQAKEQQS